MYTDVYHIHLFQTAEIFMLWNLVVLPYCLSVVKKHYYQLIYRYWIFPNIDIGFRNRVMDGLQWKGPNVVRPNTHLERVWLSECEHSSLVKHWMALSNNSTSLPTFSLSWGCHSSLLRVGKTLPVLWWFARTSLSLGRSSGSVFASETILVCWSRKQMAVGAWLPTDCRRLVTWFCYPKVLLYFHRNDWMHLWRQSFSLQVIVDLKGSECTWSYQTPPSSPSTTVSRKSSMCRLVTMATGNCPSSQQTSPTSWCSWSFTLPVLCCLPVVHRWNCSFNRTNHRIISD